MDRATRTRQKAGRHNCVPPGLHRNGGAESSEFGFALELLPGRLQFAPGLRLSLIHI